VTQWFVDDDPGYLAWLAAHPEGVVLNTWAHPAASDLVLHRARCRMINRRMAPGRTWTHTFGKACADTIEDLLAWAIVRTHDVPRVCRICDVTRFGFRANGSLRQPLGTA
jgi:hypothetical protein